MGEQFVGQAGPVGGHEVAGGDGAQGEGVVVGAFVAANADAAHIGEDSEVLADVFVKIGFFDFFAEDGVRFAQDVEFFRGEFADDANGKTGTGEGLTPDHVFGKAEFQTGFADFVFEEIAQRFDQAFKFDVFGQAADIVVAFNDGAADAGFNDIGVDGSLDEIIAVGKC